MKRGNPIRFFSAVLCVISAASGLNSDYLQRTSRYSEGRRERQSA